MRFFSRSKVSIVVPFIALLGLLGALMMSGILRAPAIHAAGDSHSGGFYRQTNLVSDIAGLARVHDTNLVNAWGLSHSPTSPWWISDNGTGLATVYKGDGTPFAVGGKALVVTIPPPAGSPAGTTAAPTGNVFNGTSDFVVTENNVSGPSLFIFATEDGTIAGWNPNVPAFLSTTAILVVDNSATGAVYKGLALGRTSAGNFLYATNFHAGNIDVFDKDFKPASLAGSFSDPEIPAGFAPFNIQNLGNQLYVTYAKQDAAKHDDVAGEGNGFVNVFDTSGHFIERIASRGKLNSPWGLALAPAGFGKFSHDLLIGNFGDGRIHAFDLSTDTRRGQLRGLDGKPITIDGLWALTFGRDGQNNGPTNLLFFTAGIDKEHHGLFGSLSACQNLQCQ